MVSRLLTLGLGVCLLLGCAPPSADTSTTAADGAAPTQVDVPTTSSTSEPETTTTARDATTTTSGRPLAPDFTLQLGEGGIYTLSEGARPVYLVFWAEW